MWANMTSSFLPHGVPYEVEAPRTDARRHESAAMEQKQSLTATEKNMKNSSREVRVCVTGGAGFIGSWLVKKLQEKGYTVHATLRNTEDEEKTGLLRRLVPGAADRLRLFEADLFDAATFAPAIAGCQFVFLVATPYGLEAAAGSKVSSQKQ
ncbi:NADPH HC-toxin reductase 1-like isoform X2 [Miscanthus floridulus]|uniref:NADPH HC-toxin reductase 1-like isoform X2 n=1 Tax=Miscanthus floridulus TaxID=154761 RepID=UPI0034578B41